MYGDAYETLWVASNCNLQFGSALQYAVDDYLPINTYTFYSYLPVFEPFYADFDVVDSGNVTWSLETLAPGQRVVVIRYSDIKYPGHDSAFLDMDVLLYETPAGQIDVRYYRVDVDPSGRSAYQIGMQSGEGLLGSDGGGVGSGLHGDNHRYYTSYFILHDQLPIDAAAQSALQNTTITFNFTGIEVTNSTCGGLGYDFFDLSLNDLTYIDVPTNNAIYFRMVRATAHTPLTVHVYIGASLCSEPSNSSYANTLLLVLALY